MKNLPFGLIATLLLLSFCQEKKDDSSGLSQEANLRINYYTVSCTGEMTGNCLLIQEDEKIGTDEWTYFYFEDGIEGFEFESGYIYDLLVNKSYNESPLADGSSVNYELVSNVV